ncbi:MAG TPA: hypothetical protein VF595_00120, partial [Tepidisphaeraceae bacterium]
MFWLKGLKMALPGLQTRWPLRQWQAHLQELYSNQNKQRSPLETLSRVVEMASGVARGVREDDSETLRTFVPRTLAWILGLATQLEIDLQDAVWRAYPGVCTHCHSDQGCSCKIHPEKRRRLKDEDEIYRLQQNHTLPASLPEWQAMFGKIYLTINQVAAADKCVLHFLEELGEVSEAVRYKLAPESKYTPAEIKVMLQNELADLFAWFIAVTNLERVEIDAYMQDIYEYVCPECGKSPCDCHPYHV